MSDPGKKEGPGERGPTTVEDATPSSKGDIGRDSSPDLAGSLPDGSAAAFLRWLRPAGPDYLVSIPAKGNGGGLHAGCDLGWAERENAERGIYYHLNPLKGPPASGKATKGEVAAVEFLHVDVDPRPGKDLAEERARILALLTTGLPPGAPPPSAVVDSGRGYQALWRLREPLADLALAERYCEQLVLLFGGDRGTWNADRVLRLPGFVNHKTGAGAAVVSLTDAAYDLSRFVPAPKEAPATKAEVALPEEFLRFADLDLLDVSDRIRVLLRDGVPEGESRNEAALACANAVYAAFLGAGAGDPVASTAGVLLDERCRIGDYYLRDNKGRARSPGETRKRLERDIGKAKARVEADLSKERERGEAEGEPEKGKQRGPTVENVRAALEAIGVTLRFDEFAERVKVEGLPGFGPYSSDDAAIEMRFRMEEEQALGVSKDRFHDLLRFLARRNPVHPVREYLSRVERGWDGRERLSGWMVDYLGAPDSKYARAVGLLVLVAAVRRVRRPGSKWDEIVILEGPQGNRKSEAVRALAKNPEWFSDSLSLGADPKEVIEQTAGIWIVELGELKGLRTRELAAQKQSLSRRADRARLSYGREREDRPRCFVPFGTTNEGTYLLDPTGNRRFWPVGTGKIEVERLAADLDQLWGEAAHTESRWEGEVRLDPALYEEVRKEQEAREEEDPWEHVLAGRIGDADGKIAVEDVWKLLELPPGRRSPREEARMGRAMKRLGWERTRGRKDGDRMYFYVRGGKEEERLLVLHVKDDADDLGPSVPTVFRPAPTSGVPPLPEEGGR